MVSHRKGVSIAARQSPRYSPVRGFSIDVVILEAVPQASAPGSVDGGQRLPLNLCVAKTSQHLPQKRGKPFSHTNFDGRAGSSGNQAQALAWLKSAAAELGREAQRAKAGHKAAYDYYVAWNTVCEWLLTTTGVATTALGSVNLGTRTKWIDIALLCTSAGRAL